MGKGVELRGNYTDRSKGIAVASARTSVGESAPCRNRIRFRKQKLSQNLQRDWTGEAGNILHKMSTCNEHASGCT